MAQCNVSAVLNVPDVGATDRQIDEWIEYNMGYRGNISMENPLQDHPLEANTIEVDPH